MSDAREKCWLTFESFPSEQPSGAHKSMSPKAAKQLPLSILEYRESWLFKSAYFKNIPY